jgi:PiT family inorganic phosphate transporter
MGAGCAAPAARAVSSVMSPFGPRIRPHIRLMTAVPDQPPARKTTVDKDLKRFAQIEKATRKTARRGVNLGLGVVFLLGIWAFTAIQTFGLDGNVVLIAAAIVGGYMALNIGANDVANNVGPAVGSRALTLVGALVIAAVFEAAGAILAGGDVVTTISKNIIDAEAIASGGGFVWAMMAALLAAALWVNLATWIGAPVSTTHAVVGGVLGAGIAAAGGVGAVDWSVMGAIIASWVISPLLGGVIAALFLGFAKAMILYRDDKIAAAKRWVPVMVAVLAGAFSIYLVMKGLKHLWKPGIAVTLAIGLAAFVATYLLVKPAVARRARFLENRRKAVSDLFTIPLICGAALLSFAHGANDVANAVGPLAAIVSAVTQGTVAAKVSLPLWVLVVGAIGIAVGLLLYGPRVIKIVGERITKLDRVRAFCVALSAAITVIIASALGLPVSSTHIAVGAVFGVGFLREFLTNRRTSLIVTEPAGAQVAGPGPEILERRVRKAQKRKLVRRRYITTIVAAWLITVPCAALLSALLFLGLTAVFGV